jgi:hypothetical protein
MIENGEGKTANDNKYFVEDELAFAPYSSVTVDVKVGVEIQKFEGEVLSCITKDEKKVYSVLVQRAVNNSVRMFHGVRKNCMRYRRVLNKPERNQHVENKSIQVPAKQSEEASHQNSNDSSEQEATSQALQEKFEVKEVQFPKPQSNGKYPKAVPLNPQKKCLSRKRSSQMKISLLYQAVIVRQMRAVFLEMMPSAYAKNSPPMQLIKRVPPLSQLEN